MDNDEEIILEIEEELLTCKKSILIEHSEYFKVMFEGNFIERYQAVIKLHEVDFRSFTIILKLITDMEYLIEEKDIYLVLHMACMLQFHKIRSICTERITEMLDVNNCLKIWHTAELLDITPLYLKAKSLSLMEFDYIKYTDYFLELNIKQLHDYLANVLLIVKSEVDVFRGCIKWWYRNSIEETLRHNFSDNSKLFYYFLTLLDFKALSNDDIKEMMSIPHIETDKEIICILNNIIDKRNGIYVDDKILSKVNILLNGRGRREDKYPCVLINNDTSSISRHVLLFGTTNSTFQRVMTVLPEKIAHDVSFHVLGYKQFIFLLSGTLTGYERTPTNSFWAYDTITERWQRKPDMPYRRKYYESCIAQDIIYIVGGTGFFIDMFWYDCRLNEWSELIPLPCRCRNLRCCVYKNSIFLMDFLGSFGYLFNSSVNNWITFNICDTQGLVTKYPQKKEFVFSFGDFIYIKDNTAIIKLKLTDNQLEVISTTLVNQTDASFTPSTVCDGFLYTIYTRRVGDSSLMVFDKLDISNCTSEVIMEYDIETLGNVKLYGELYRFNNLTKLFGLSSYSMVKKSTYLTDVSPVNFSCC